MSRFARKVVTVGALVGLMFGMSPAKAVELDHDVLCSPSNPNKFNLTIDNAYFPLPVGGQWSYVGPDDNITLGLRITVRSATEPFYDGTIQTRVVEEMEWVDSDADGSKDPKEKLIEVSQNYFAQTDAGTVCYFGEDVQIYNKGGKFKGDSSGSWRADAPGNAPGIFMPASPRTGQEFQIEDAPGVAMDEAEIVDVDTVEVPYGEFEAIEVEDCNPLEPGPDNCGTKYYASGVGLIVDGDVELVDFTFIN
jgi:hypothetical protein